MAAAATSSEMPSGIFTSSFAATLLSCAYMPTGALAVATRSPTFRPLTPSPSASTTPATSFPSPEGSGTG